ncbi:hypothetical protein J1N35_007782 [Gossypium stocksii]|uniref:Uncharacterized protein n=1 Tax=Gossypium stocksii TaxID=47602 RepID=A0A9D4AFK1_9ROSI|nr:hypothetical protein J1N35_007782 [Gossypium stocksii]
MSKGSSGKVKAVVPLDSGCVASAPKFKRCKVSAIRDFSPGCGRMTAPNFGSRFQSSGILSTLCDQCVTVCFVLITG